MATCRELATCPQPARGSGSAGLPRELAVDKSKKRRPRSPMKLKLEIEAEEKAQAKRERAEEKRAYWAEVQAAVKRLWHGSGKGYSYRIIRDVLWRDMQLSVSHETIRRWFKEGKIDKRYKPKG